MNVSAFPVCGARARARFVLTAAAALGLLAFAGCGRVAKDKATTEVRPLVELTPVVWSDAAVPVRASGVLARKTEADLAFKIGGIVESVAVRVGDAVTAGQELARLRLDEIDAQFAQARSARDKAQRDLARIERLQAGAVATLENLQDAHTALEVAEAQLRIAEFNRRYAVITAPAAGRILRRSAEPNELVAPGRAVLGFASDADGWIVRASLADDDVARVRIGDRATVQFDAAGAAQPGRISQIADAAEPATRTTPIEVALDQAPADGRSDVVVSVVLTPRAVPVRPRLPASALIEGARRAASLFVVENGGDVARRIVVEIEAIEGEDAFLRTPLPRDAQVVARGAEYLHDGERVSVATK